MTRSGRQVLHFGRVVVRGVFPPGTPVSLVEVADRAVHSAGGHRLALGTADESGVAEFARCQFGVKYFIVGRVDGGQVEVPVWARPDEHWDGVPRTVLPDTAPEAPSSSPVAAPALHGLEVMIAPAVGSGGSVQPLPQRQQDVPPGIVQMSDTPLGTATPVDPADTAVIQRHRDAVARMQREREAQR